MPRKTSSGRNWSELYSSTVSPELVKLGKKIESFRLKQKMTKEDFANELEVGLFHYYRISKGTAKISLPTLIKIAKALKIKVRDLIDF